MQFFRFLTIVCFSAAFCAASTANEDLVPITVDFHHLLNIFGNHSTGFDSEPEAHQAVGSMHALETNQVRGDEIGSLRGTRGVEAEGVAAGGFYSLNNYGDNKCSTLTHKYFFQLNQCVRYAKQPGTFIKFTVENIRKDPVEQGFFVSDNVIKQYSDARCTKLITTSTKTRPFKRCYSLPGVITTVFPSLNFPAGDYTLLNLYSTPSACTTNNANNVQTQDTLILSLYANNNGCVRRSNADYKFTGCNANGAFQYEEYKQVANQYGSTYLPCKGPRQQVYVIPPSCNKLGSTIFQSDYEYSGYTNIICRKK